MRILQTSSVSRRPARMVLEPTRCSGTSTAAGSSNATPTRSSRASLASNVEAPWGGYGTEPPVVLDHLAEWGRF